MAIITVWELFDIVAMSLIVGVIFSSVLKKYRGHHDYDPLEAKTGIDWKVLKAAIIITAPAIILHELGHKFVALSFGINATFHAAYAWLGIGLLLALMNTGIIFFVPAYVSIGTGATPLQYSAIAFAGPFVNLLIYLLAVIVMKYKLVGSKKMPLVILTRKINGFLFLFNMIPLGFFDGAKVFQGLIQTFF